MRLFAIGDLHLPGGADKPMNVFGPQWDRHTERIAEAWRMAVTGEDTVLIPGDISWAMQLSEAEPDLQWIGSLPGRKVLIRGNHDYWWNSVTRVRSVLPAGMTALQHDACDLGECVVCGTRGWLFPSGEAPLSTADDKIYRRETERLRLALEHARETAHGRPIITMLHYPPLSVSQRYSSFTELMEQYGVRLCVYGHLHGQGIRSGFTGTQRGVRYALVSCDSLDFKPRPLPTSEWDGPAV